MKIASQILAGSLFAALVAAWPAFGADTQPAQAETNATPQFFFRLIDGTRLLCRPAAERIPFATAYAEMNIAWSNVAKITFQRKEQKATLSLRNGDLLQGSIPLPTLKVQSIIGELTMAMTNLEEIAVNGSTDPASRTGPVNDTPQARSACINKLSQVDAAKEQWAMEYNRSNGSVPAANDVSPYIKNGFQAIRCPSGGTISINPLGAKPTCSVPGHTL